MAFDFLDRFWKETRDRVSGIDYDNNEVLLSGKGLRVLLRLERVVNAYVKIATEQPRW